MNVSEDRINTWAKPPSETEDAKCQSAKSMVVDALRARFGNGITIIHQGSHRNRTNIRADSDVDIAVVYDGSYFSDLRNLPAEHHITHWNTLPNATYTYEQFKNDVHQVLKGKFGEGVPVRKNKCIRVPGNTSRVNADVVPAFQSKRFSSLGVVSNHGIGILTDAGVLIHSYPDQHYASGVAKNDATLQAYKAVVRILKNARNEMVDKGLLVKDEMSSFFIESLVWNAPDHRFRNATYREDAREVLAHIWADMRNAQAHPTYKEVSQLQWLLRENHHTPAKAETFTHAVWNYLAP